jgi:hypothetical protein
MFAKLELFAILQNGWPYPNKSLPITKEREAAWQEKVMHLEKE